MSWKLSTTIKCKDILRETVLEVANNKPKGLLGQVSFSGFYFWATLSSTLPYAWQCAQALLAVFRVPYMVPMSTMCNPCQPCTRQVPWSLYYPILLAPKVHFLTNTTAV